MPSGADEQAREAARRAYREKERKRVRIEAEQHHARLLVTHISGLITDRVKETNPYLFYSIGSLRSL